MRPTALGSITVEQWFRNVRSRRHFNKRDVIELSVAAILNPDRAFKPLLCCNGVFFLCASNICSYDGYKLFGKWHVSETKFNDFSANSHLASKVDYNLITSNKRSYIHYHPLPSKSILLCTLIMWKTLHWTVNLIICSDTRFSSKYLPQRSIYKYIKCF